MYEQEKWDLRVAGARRAGLEPQSVDLVVFTAYSAKTVASPEGRKRLLRDHLTTQLAAVSRLSPLEAAPPSTADGSASPPTFALESVCAPCRGHCCRNGGDRGYLSARTLQRVLAADPAVGGEALIDTYVSHVPKRSYAGSCIYHAASGCALPRALRSEICTSHLCRGLTKLSEEASLDPGRAAIGVFEHAVRPARVILVHNAEVRELRPQRWNGIS